MNTSEQSVTEYLEYMSSSMEIFGRNKIGSYNSFEDFVLKNGQLFKKRGRLPKYARMGRAKQCFKNAAKLAQSHPNLIYVEGYAYGVIPMLHAWCVTKDGAVIDPTWKNGIEYFGVPIRRSYLISSMATTGVYGVIDLWKEGFPILKAEPKEFKQEIVIPCP